MAASSSSTLQPLTSSSVPQHDIFLSHSGAQKPFVTALYDRLQTRYSTFFDITDHSLPLGEDFPLHIFHAARTCRLAVVVLSPEYVRSKWPMLELCAFFDATPQPKIVPLFFKLAPTDLKQKQNKERWRAAWEEFAREDPRIDVSKWESALKKLSRCNGISLILAEEESTYVDKVFLRICESLHPSMRHDFSGIQGIHRMFEVVHTRFEGLDSNHSKVCMLGMYGLPGIGKSTLCRYLCDYMFPKFAGRVLYLELPTDADDEQLLVKSKELLTKLMNFNNKIDLSNVSHLRQVYHLLRGIGFSKFKVFLVVDNISSEKSRNFVKALLRLDLAVGSKVLMVARSEAILNLLLQEDGLHPSSHNNVYDSMSAPSLNYEEALRVLLQFGDGVGLPYDYALETTLTPRDRQMMEKVVNMFSFEGIHLPLALKILGEQLGQQKLDVDNWCKMMTSSLTRVGIWKEKALKQLVLQSFKALPLELQTLFLDVALFILPLSYYLDGGFARGDEAFLHLSLIHGCEQEEIEVWMRELEEHGFLTIWKGGCCAPAVFVHEFYLEFAASIKEASKYYWSSGVSWSKFWRNQAIEVARNTGLGLRTVVLDLEEGHEEFRFSPQFSSVKAMVLRNCKSLKILQGIENLTGLASVEIHNCPSLKWVEPPAIGCEQPNVRRFRWSNQEEKGCNAQEELEALSMSKKALWKAIWESLPQMGMIRRRMMNVDDLLLQMRGLEVLRLENTGIRQLVALSGCLPELRVLEVRERHMKQFHVCNLPNLEHFEYFGDASSKRLWKTRMDIDDFNGFIVSNVSLVPRKGVMTKRGFLAGCPKLQSVKVQCASFEDGPQGITIPSSHLKYLWVNCLWNASRLPDLTAAAESLEGLLFSDCRELISLNLGCTFRNLQILILQDCPNVTEVTGLDGFPNLHTLQIGGCTRLKIVSGLGGLASLREFEVWSGCPNLQHCLLPDLESSTELRSIRYRGPWLMDRAFNVRELLNLECLDLLVSTTSRLLGIENLNHLKELRLGGSREQILNLEGSAEQTSATGVSSSGSTLLVNLATLILGVGVPSHLSFLSTMCLDGLRTLASLKGIEFFDSLTGLELWRLPNLTSLEGMEFLDSLTNLHLWDLPNLTSLEGIEFLDSLTYLHLWDLPNLTSLQGIEFLDSLTHLCLEGLPNLTSLQGIGSLRDLERLSMFHCASLEELPSLSALGKLRSISCHNCDKLSSVEGCGGLQHVESVSFVRCTSLACFPLPIRDNWSIRELRIEGSKFASAEAAMAWVEDEEVPQPLRIASMEALRWEFRCKNRDACDMVLDKVILKMAERGYDDGDNSDEEVLTTQLSLLAKDYFYFSQETYRHKGDSEILKEYYESRPRMLKEVLHCLAKLPKQCRIDQCCCDELVGLLVLNLFNCACTFTSFPPPPPPSLSPKPQ